MSDTVTWNRVLALARGCHDYNAGYLGEPEHGIYHHGIDTVIRVLEAARTQGDAPDLQTRTVEAIGANHGTGDVWAAIIAELPEGAARDAAIARRDLGIARYGVPLGLRDLDTAQRDLREELLDAAAYGVELAALLTAADPDDVTADVVVFHAAEAYASATGLFYPKAIGRAVRRLARGVR